MKKIMCIILMLAVVLTVASCGKKDDVPMDEVIKDIVAQSSPTKIVTIVEYVSDSDTLSSIYTTEIDKANNKSILKYDINKYGDIAAGDPDRIMNLVGEIYYVNGAVKATSDSSWSTAVDLAPEFKLDVSRSLFEEYTVSEDGTTITGKVKGENVSRVLGTAQFSADEISITVMTNGTYIYSLDISYTTSTGARVVVNTSYTYNTITLDF